MNIKQFNYFKSQTFKYKGIGAVMTVAFLAVVISLNLVLNLIFTKFDLQFDLTKNKVYALSDQSKNLLENLDQDIDIYWTVQDGQAEYINDVEIDKIIKKYLKASSKLKFHKIDVNKNPTFGKSFLKSDEKLYPGGYVFVCGKKYSVINLEDLISTDGLIAEQRFTSAIDYVTNDRDVKIGVVIGHGEVVDIETLKPLLRKENYDVVDINLLTDEIEDEVGALLIIEPQYDFEQHEMNKLINFTNKGKGVMVYFDVVTRRFNRLEAYLAEYGLSMERDYIIETDSKFVANCIANMVMLPKVNNHDITNNLLGKNIAVPAASSIKIVDKQGVIAAPLLTTSENAFGKIDLNSSNMEKTPEDIDGSLVIAAAAEKENQGDANVVQRIAIAPLGILAFVNRIVANNEFVLYSLKWLNQNNESVFIQAKELRAQIPILDEYQYLVITVISFALPFIVAVLGLGVWLKRRYT